MRRSWEELALSPVAYALLTPEGRFLKVNRATCELFGYPEEALLQMTARDLTHPEDHAQSAVLVDRAVRHREGTHQVIKRYLHRQGNVIWTLLSTVLERDQDNRPEIFVSRIEDITERVLSDELLRGFAHRIEIVKEQERQGIARELHEELGQTFAGLKLELDSLQKVLPPEAHPQAARLSYVVDDVLSSVRRFTASLRPPILDDLGLESALEWLLQKFCGQANLHWRFPRNRPSLALDWETRIALFRIAQEGLQRVIRHAQASHIEMTLSQDGDEIVFRIIDDGKLSASGHDNELEFYIIRERVNVLRGKVELKPQPPQGSCLEVRLPAPLAGAGGPEFKSFWE